MPENEAELRIIVKAIDQTSDVFNRVQESARNMGQGANQGSDAINSALQRVQGSASGLSDQFSSLGRSFGSMSQSVVHSTDPLNLALQSINLGVSNITQHLAGLNSGFAMLASAVGIATALGAATEFLATSLSHAAQETTNMIQLSAIWKSMNRGNEESMNKLVDQVKDLSREGMYSSQSVVGATKLFASFGNIASDQLVKATKVAQDFAAFTGMGMEHAAYMIRYAATGMYGELNRVGIQLSETAKQSKDFNIILEEIAQKMSGQMAAAMETYTGQVAALDKTFDRIRKAIGHVLEEALVPVMKQLGEHFSLVGKQIEEAFKSGKFDPAITKMTELFGRLAKGVANAVDGIVGFAQTADFNTIAERIFAVAESVQTLATYSGKLLAFLLTLPGWVYKAVEGLILFKVAMMGIRLITGTLAGIMGRLAGLSAGNLAAWLRETTGVRALTEAYRDLARAKGAVAAQGPYSPWSPNMGPKILPGAGGQRGRDYTPDGPAITREPGTWRERMNAAGSGLGRGAMLGGAALGAIPALTSEEMGAGGSAALMGGAAIQGAFMGGPLGAVLTAGAAAWAKIFTQDIPALFEISRQEARAWRGAKEAGGPSKEATVEGTANRVRLERQMTGKSLLQIRADMVAAGVVGDDGKRKDLTKEQIAILDEAIKREQEFEKAGKKALEVVGREAVTTAQKVGGIFANLSEEQIKEKYKDVQQAIKNFYANVEAADKEAVAAQKASIDSVTQSKVIAEQRKAEVEFAAAGQSITRAHEKAAVEIKQINDRIAAENQLIRNQETDTQISQEEAKKKYKELDDQRVREIKAVQQEETQSVQKALEQRYALHQQNADKLRTLQNDLFQNEKATIEALQRIRASAMNESEQLAAKSAELQAKMAAAYQAAADNPERAIQLFKEAQGLAQGLAQNLDALKKSAIDGARGFTEASISLDKALEKATNVSPFVSWQKDLQAVNQLLMEANQAYAQGDVARAKQLAEQGKSKATALGTSAPQGMEIAAIQQAQNLLGSFRQVWQSAVNEEIRQKTAAQALGEQKAKESGEQIRILIQDQIKHASQMQELYKQQIAALEANTAALRGRQASGEGAGASPITNKKGEQVTGGAAGTPGAKEIVGQGGTGGSATVPAGQGTGTGSQQGYWYGTPGQTIGGGQGISSAGMAPVGQTPETNARWKAMLSSEMLAKEAAYKLTAEERAASEGFTHLGADKFGKHMYQDKMTGNVLFDNGEIQGLAKSREDKDKMRAEEQAKNDKRFAYLDRMERAGFGQAVEGMSLEELDDVMGTEKRQSDYKRGTGTYDKRLGSQENVWASVLGGDFKQPFYNAVDANLQPKSSRDSEGGGASDKGDKPADKFQNIIDQMGEGINKFVASAAKPIKIEVTATGGASVASVDMWG